MKTADIKIYKPQNATEEAAVPVGAFAVPVGSSVVGIKQATGSVESLSGGGGGGTSGKVSLVTPGINSLNYSAHNGKEVHAEAGVTEVTMAGSNFQVSGAFVFGSFEIFNYTGISLPLKLTGTLWSGGISTDGETTNDLAGAGTLLTIPHTMKARIVFDTDGWVRAVILGSEVTQAELDTKEPKVAGKGLSEMDFTTAKDTKLTGIATGATANDTDANLKARANHTGTQAQSTIVNLTTDLAAKASVKTPLAAYSTSSTYAVGDQVVQTDIIYQCITAITVAEAFTIAKWKVISASTATSSYLGSATRTQEKLVTLQTGAAWNVNKARTQTGLTGDCFVEWKNTGTALDFGWWGLDSRAPGATDYAPYNASVYGISANTTNYKAAGVDGATTVFTGTRATNDILRLERKSGIVRAYQNGVQKYTWVTTNTGTLYFGGTFVEASSGLHDIRMGTFATDGAEVHVNAVWELVAAVTQTESNFEQPIVTAPIYANNAAAKTGGLTIGSVYRTGADPDILCVVH